MSALPPYLCRRDTNPGGIVGYPLDRLRQEVAALALRFHWSYETIMNMEHRERRMWTQELARLSKSSP